ncbi:MAG: NADH-quinone oxidoreductase subunit C [Asgard group archaeon]|nr:NADH-quinone oxidoreductase subunit C [Asgard group archaeon]
MSSKYDTEKKSIPLLLKNLKKAFGKNIQGPMKHFEREYQASTKKEFLNDIVKFLSNRGVKKLASINAWKSNNELRIAYHFIAKIGTDFLDTKITIIVITPTENVKIDSITSIYQNARIFEEEIKQEFLVEFSN